MQIVHQIAAGNAESIVSIHYSPREGRKAFKRIRESVKYQIKSETFNRIVLRNGESYGTR